MGRTLTFADLDRLSAQMASYFQHHTYLEWLYLLEGLSELSPERQEQVKARCADYESQCAEALEKDLNQLKASL